MQSAGGISLTLLLFLVFIFLSTCGSHDEIPSNIILISIDTLRADHLSCYGYSRPTSPALDDFAAQGLLFEDASAPSPWTLPSHASMLTGRYPGSHGVIDLMKKLPAAVPTLADVLQIHQFKTAAIVNSYWLSPKNGLHRGFKDFTYIEEDVAQTVPSKVTDHALNWLSKNEGEPFFLFLHYYDVHSDYRALSVYKKAFARPYHGMVDGGTDQLLLYRRGLFSLNEKDVRRLIDLYDAGIRQLDDELGRLFSFLAEKKLFDNSLILITSDHGEEFLEHGGVLHGRTYYQEVINVPLMMRGPNIPRGRCIKAPVSLIDIMPTVLSMLDIPWPDALDGMNLAAFWRETGKPLPQRYVIAEADWENTVDQNFKIHGKIVEKIKRYHLTTRRLKDQSRTGNIIVDNMKQLIRFKKYKLHYNRLTQEKELYDLETDPMEKNDLTDQHRTLVDTLLSKLEEFSREKGEGTDIDFLTAEEISNLKKLGYVQ